MSGGKGPKQQKTTTKQNQTQESSGTGSTRTYIPDFLQPLITGAAPIASGALSNLQDLAGGNLVAPFTADQLSAFDLARSFGTSAPYTTGLNTLQETAAGDYLFGGPGFDAAVNAAVNAATPGILSTFGAAGRGTGGLAQTAIAQSAIDAFANQYGQERERQLAAANALPQFALTPIDLLLQTGGMQQQQAQNEISAPFSAQQALLNAALSGLPITSLLGTDTTQQQKGTLSGTSVTTQPLSRNTGAGILGGALSGLGIAKALGLPLTGPAGIVAGLGGGLLGSGILG
jgi:hypothetical protein